MSVDPARHEPGVHHEESDVDIAAIFKFGAGLFLVAVVVHVVVYNALVLLERTQSVATVDFPIAAGEARTPPGPRLQVTPREEMRQLVATDEEALSSYRWVDRDLGIVRIPIDVAMRLTLERGLPARGAMPTEPSTLPTNASPTGVTGVPQP